MKPLEIKFGPCPLCQGQLREAPSKHKPWLFATSYYDYECRQCSFKMNVSVYLTFKFRDFNVTRGTLKRWFFKWGNKSEEQYIKETEDRFFTREEIEEAEKVRMLC